MLEADPRTYIPETPGWEFIAIKDSLIRGEIAATISAVAPERVESLIGQLIHSKETGAREAALDLLNAQTQIRNHLPALKTALKKEKVRIQEEKENLEKAKKNELEKVMSEVADEKEKQLSFVEQLLQDK